MEGQKPKDFGFDCLPGSVPAPSKTSGHRLSYLGFRSQESRDGAFQEWVEYKKAKTTSAEPGG